MIIIEFFFLNYHPNLSTIIFTKLLKTTDYNEQFQNTFHKI